MKKIISVLAIVSVLVLGGCSTKEEPVKDSKKQEETTLHITVKDEVNNKELYKGDVSVDGNVKTLADFLEKADKLKVEMEDGQYGKTLISILGVKTEDFNTGPWWLYESKNNESCVAAGQCDAASSLKIKDGDYFTFKYTSTF